MYRAYHQWHSPALDRQMELLIFGHSGAPCLVFPTSHGRFFEYEDRGMVAVLGDQIEAGQLQLICVDSISSETWYSPSPDTNMRLWREDQYQHYLIHEVLPLVRQTNPTHYLITTGCSLGAMQAAVFAFRHPYLVNRIVGLSGLYDIKRFFTNYTSSVYFHNPVDFLPNLNDEQTLAQLRAMDIILVTGRDDPNVGSTEYMSQTLWSKGIWNAMRIWDGWFHDWPYWQEMIARYISGYD